MYARIENIMQKFSWEMYAQSCTQQPIASKRARLGRYLCFCSSLPNIPAQPILYLCERITPKLNPSCRIWDSKDYNNGLNHIGL